MKLMISRTALADITSWGAYPVTTRPVEPVLGGLRLDAASGTLTAAGTDPSCQVTCRWTAPAEIGEPGSALVPARPFADLVGTLPAGMVDLSAGDGALTVRCGAARLTLRLLDLAEYPSMPLMPPAAATVSTAELARALDQVAFCAADPDPKNKPVLTAVHFMLDAPAASLVAMTPYHGGVTTLPWEQEAGTVRAANIPAARLRKLAASLKGESGAVVTAGFTEGQDGYADLAGFSDGCREMILRCVAGEYIRWQDALAVPAGVLRAEVVAAEMSAALRRVLAVTPRNQTVRLAFAGETAALRGGSADDMSGTDAVEASCSGEMELNVNPAYLQDGLDAIGGKVAFLMTSPTKSVIMVPAENNEHGYRYLFQPRRPDDVVIVE